MATNTYVALDKVTVGSAVSSITFSSINQTYTDLVVVANIIGTVDSSNIRMTFNGDSSALYSPTWLAGSGSSATSGRDSGQTSILLSNGPLGSGSSTSPVVFNASIQSYTNTNVYKTVLSRYGTANATYSGASAQVSLYRSLNAITSITMTAQSTTFAIGSTFSLYGIKEEVGESTPKATGGIVTSDATYWYHTFTTSGNFVPNQTLSCDYLVVAGGGGGNGGDIGNGGGGGAGGLLTGTSMSLTAGTKTILVGAGGSAGAGATPGSNSVLYGSSTITATGGGEGGTYLGGGGNGGCGGGAGQWGGSTVSGGAGSQGFKGGDSSGIGAGSGGGMGAAGQDCTGSTGGNGGIGIANSITGTAVYYSGGGGGSSHNNSTTQSTGGTGGGGAGGYRTAALVPVPPTAGTANTGGGGGGWGEYTSSRGGAPGGSGVVIIKYAK